MNIFADIGLIGILAVLVILGLLTILLPLSAYAAQKWVYKTYEETREINQKLSELLTYIRKIEEKKDA